MLKNLIFGNSEDCHSKINNLIKDGNVKGVRDYLDTEVNPDLNSALIIACICKQHQIVKLLLSNGADIHHEAECALEIAILSNDRELVKLLVSSDADINSLSDGTIESIIDNCSTESIEYLLEIGLELNLEMIHHAIEVKNLETFKLFYNRMPDLNLSDLWITACENNSTQILNFMLDLPFKPNLKNRSLICHIIKNSEVDLFKKILNRIADPKTILSTTILKCVCIASNCEIAKIILDLGISPNNSDSENIPSFDPENIPSAEIKIDIGSTPLEIALGSNNISMKMIKLLLDYGAEITYECLQNAYRTNDLEIFSLIYQSREWTYSELSHALYAQIKLDISEDIWKYLQKELSDNLQEEYLKKIIEELLTFRQFDFFEYFVDSYGTDRIVRLIDFDLYIEETEQYLKDFMNRY